MIAEVLLLRLEAPLMSFGGVAVDDRRVTDELPGLSMLTGLLANALGFDHGETEKLDRLQQRLRFAVRQDAPGELVSDFHTVDLGQEELRQGWTTTGEVEGRKGGAASSGTHIRRREYLADAAYTVAVSLDPAEESPNLDDLQSALSSPERPLFVGRKSCLPSRPILDSATGPVRVAAQSVIGALVSTPPLRAGRRPDPSEPLRVWWSADESPPESVSVGRRLPVWDRRDWKTQIHTGRRWLLEGHQERDSAETSAEAGHV